MPTFVVRELYDGRDGEESVDSRDFVRIWSVQQTDGGNPASINEVLDARGIPSRGDPYVGATVSDNDAGLACIGVRARHNKSPKLFLVEARYSSNRWGNTFPSEGTSSTGTGGGDDGDETGEQIPPGFGGGDTGQGPASESPVQIDDPLLRPSVVRYGMAKRTEILIEDKNGVKIKNSANAAFDPPVEIERARLAMYVTQNRALFDPNVIETYHMAVNSKKWARGEPKTWRCEDINAERAFEEGKFYWKVSFMFVRNRDKWNPRKILDAGAYYLSGTTQMRFADGVGGWLTRGLLNGGGERLGAASSPVYLDFDVHEELDFNALKLF